MMTGNKAIAGVLAAMMVLPVTEVAYAETGAAFNAAAKAAFDREVVVQILMNEGATREQAETVVASLEPEDIAVFAENPNMVQSGEFLGAFLLLWALILLIFAAGNNN